MLSAQVEPFIERFDELAPLLPIHWAELALYQDKMPLDVDLDAYQRLEDAGSLLYVTMRNDGELVGYFVGIVGTSPHYKSTLSCKMDVVFVRGDFRGAGAGRLLLETIRAELKRRGVAVWFMGSKNHKPIEYLFLASGFEPCETYFSQWIGD